MKQRLKVWVKTTTGIQYSSGSITLSNPGTYKVYWLVQSQQVSQFSLTLDGTVLPGAVYNINAGQTIFEVPNSSMILQLINTTSGNVLIPISNSNGTQLGINVSIIIERLD